MNRKVSLFAAAGAGCVAAAALAIPAQAAPAAPKPPPGSQTLVGYFGDRDDCEWVGGLGRQQTRWIGYNCDQVNYGPYRGMYSLNVRRLVIIVGQPGHHFPGGHPGPVIVVPSKPHH